MGSEISIAIIGGGASGSITAIQLLHKLKVKSNIFLIERRKENVFRGAAYSSGLAYEPLNVITARMSIFNHLPDDFYNWLKENKQAESKEEITKESYVSRRWYGDYITARVNEAAKQSELAELEIITDEVSDINFNFQEDCYELTLSNEQKINTNYLVFATGNESPANVLNKNDVTALGNRYIGNPWVGNTLENVNVTDDVLIIGTGLTMVDHVVSLQKQKHEGKIYCLSRNGYLPMEHADIQHFTLDLVEEPKDVYRLFQLVKTIIAEADSANVKWQNVLDAVRPYTSKMWRSMSATSKKYFLKRLKNFWEIHRHRMPAASAKAIKQMTENEQLALLAGCIESAGLADEKVIVRFSPKNKSDAVTLRVDWVINCTGPSGDYYQCSNPLFKNLLDKGWMSQDEFKLGIKTGVRGEVIKENGVVLQNAYAVGPLRKAMEWESTAIREIRTHAENVAISIALPAEKVYEMASETGL